MTAYKGQKPRLSGGASRAHSMQGRTDAQELKIENGTCSKGGLDIANNNAQRPVAKALVQHITGPRREHQLNEYKRNDPTGIDVLCCQFHYEEYHGEDGPSGFRRGMAAARQQSDESVRHHA